MKDPINIAANPHSPGTFNTATSKRTQGENVKVYYLPPQEKVKSRVKYARDSALSWYNEIMDYNFDKPSIQYNTGHFTQLVWKGVKKIGTGIAIHSYNDGRNQGNVVIVVTQYYPPGNYEGKYLKKHVTRPKKIEVVHEI